MVSDFNRSVSGGIKNEQVGELSPGSVGRRYQNNTSEKKHREKIHRESKFADEHKNLPFKFSKPKKSKGHSMLIRCNNCGSVFCCTNVTVGIICSNCKKFSSVSEVVRDEQ